MSSVFLPIPFVIRPPDIDPPKSQRRVRYINGRAYLFYFREGSMKTTHTDSHYYDKLTKSLNMHFEEQLGKNYDLLETTAAAWFDGEEEALPDTPLGKMQARCVEAGKPAKGYRHLHMYKTVVKDGVCYEKLAMTPVPETLCYQR